MPSIFAWLFLCMFYFALVVLTWLFMWDFCLWLFSIFVRMVIFVFVFNLFLLAIYLCFCLSMSYLRLRLFIFWLALSAFYTVLFFTDRGWERIKKVWTKVQTWNFINVLHIIFCHNTPKWKASSQLLQSYLVAHGRVCLVLLPLSSDTVHKWPLHKTLISSSLADRNLPCIMPRNAFSPAVADLRIRAPLVPHLVQHKHIISYFFSKCKVNKRFWHF